MKSIIKKVLNLLKKFNYKFLKPPILTGGGAMEYYDLRKIGHDYDIIISKKDKSNLLKLGYDLNLFGGKTEKDVDSTFNIKKLKLDLIVTLYQYDYKFFKKESVKLGKINVISLEKLLFTKILAVRTGEKKHERDVKKIINGIIKQQYN